MIIENEFLKAAINTKGAELTSLINKKTNLEYMWSGDPAYWGKHSPVLFPIVGTLKNDTFLFNGRQYNLPRHGFAREKEFAVGKSSASELTLVITQDESTLLHYPFNFELRLVYQLEGDTLSCKYEVFNTSETDLLFSIGGHPAFAVPLVEGSTYSDYYLEFNHDEPLVRHKLADGLIGNTVESLPISNCRLQLDQALFNEDALVIKQLKSTIVKLASEKHGHGLEFDFSGFSFVGLWAAKNAPFLCIEPWCGIADSVTHNQQFDQKEGIQVIAPGITWQRTWGVTCF